MTPTAAKKVLNYLELAQSDYLAARHLLRFGFLEQGCVLASTAVEKYLKSIIGIHGLDRSEHIDRKLLELVRRTQPAALSNLDEEFLLFLGRCFRLRYSSVSSPDFSIVINQYKTLIALDTAIFRLDGGFEIRQNDKARVTPYQRNLSELNAELISDNSALAPELLPEIVRRNNRVLEIRVEKGLNLMMASYETEGVNLVGPFLKKTELGIGKSSFQLTRG